MAEIIRLDEVMKRRGKGSTYVISLSYDKGCYRHIKISSGATLFDLHREILYAFEFDDDHAHAHAFFMDNYVWSPFDAYFSDIIIDRDMYTSDYTVGEVLGEKQKFKYVFDFGEEWVFQCRVLRIVDEPCGEAEIIRSVGEPPEQYGSWGDDWDD